MHLETVDLILLIANNENYECNSIQFFHFKHIKNINLNQIAGNLHISIKHKSYLSGKK